jgi:hypothetical protein
MSWLQTPRPAWSLLLAGESVPPLLPTGDLDLLRHLPPLGLAAGLWPLRSLALVYFLLLSFTFLLLFFGSFSFFCFGWEIITENRLKWGGHVHTAGD